MNFKATPSGLETASMVLAMAYILVYLSRITVPRARFRPTRAWRKFANPLLIFDLKYKDARLPKTTHIYSDYTLRWKHEIVVLDTSETATSGNGKPPPLMRYVPRAGISYAMYNRASFPQRKSFRVLESTLKTGHANGSFSLCTPLFSSRRFLLLYHLILS